MTSFPLRSVHRVRVLHRALAQPLAGVGILLSLWAAGSMPARAADAAAGEALAERWCASCHVVNATQKTAQSDVSSFMAIAKRDGGISGPWLAFRLLKPHPEMPQISLSRIEADNLAAYLRSLKK